MQRRGVDGQWPIRVLAAVAALAVLASCQSHPTATGSRPAAPDAVVVTSFNFPESELLGDIYARALQGAGLPVRRESDLGTREMIQPALRQGLVDVLPEYLGTALASLGADRGVDVSDSAAELAGLRQAFAPWHVQVLEPATAQNQNGLVVTSDVAHRLSLRSTSDLAAAAPGLTIGGPAECPTRPYCLQGLENVYGLHFGHFVPFDSEEQRITALTQHVIDVAVMFTTDAHLATGDLVLLEDNRHLQPAENIVPVVSDRAVQRYGPRLVNALNAVSKDLTSQSLVFLNWRVALDGKDPAAEAQGWLERHGLIRR